MLDRNTEVGHITRVRWVSASLIFAVVGFAAYPAAPVWAHHSASQFDSSREIVLEGTVRTMEWTNPHVWIRLNTTSPEGNIVEWGIESANPQRLGRKGWSRKRFQPEDQVSITVHPAKDGRPFGNFVRATLPDGSILGESEDPEPNDVDVDVDAGADAR